MPSVIYDLQDTWNAGGVVFNGIKVNVNNVASAVGSRLLRVDTAGVSQFAVDPVNGAIVGSAAGGPMGPGTINSTGFYVNGNLLGGVADGDKGDITVSVGGTVWTIDPLAVTYAKIQNVSATARVLGRFSGGAGPIEEGTGAQVNTLLPIFTDTVKGVVPPSGGGSTLFLRADQTWATPPGGGGGSGLADAYQVITDGSAPASAVGAATFKLRASAPLAVATENVNATHGKNALFSLVNATYGDIIVTGGTTWTIGPRVVTYAKMPSVAASKLNGRGSAAGAGDMEEITLGTNLTMSGTTLNATGGGGGGTFTSSATAPVAPVAGDRWYNTDTGVESTYVNDGNSSQWVQTAPTVSPPAASGFAGIAVQVFATAGAFTYTPTVGMKYCQIECIGGGGGGGGSSAGGAGSQWMMGGGGSGGYSRKTVPAATIGLSKTGTVGVGGTGGTTGGTNGIAGGQTTLTGICTANGGNGGGGATVGTYVGGAGGNVSGAVGDFVAAGAPGGGGFFAPNTMTINGGSGGSSFFGGGAIGTAPTGTGSVGAVGTNYGSGGGGAYVFDANVGRVGGAGAAGVVVITEYF